MLTGTEVELGARATPESLGEAFGQLREVCGCFVNLTNGVVVGGEIGAVGKGHHVYAAAEE